MKDFKRLTRASPLNKDLSNEATFSLIHLAGQYRIFKEDYNVYHISLCSYLLYLAPYAVIFVSPYLHTKRSYRFIKRFALTTLNLTVKSQKSLFGLLEKSLWNIAWVSKLLNSNVCSECSTEAKNSERMQEQHKESPPKMSQNVILFYFNFIMLISQLFTNAKIGNFYHR